MTRKAKVWIAAGVVVSLAIGARALHRRLEKAERRALAAEIEGEIQARAMGLLHDLARRPLPAEEPEVPDAENAAPLWTAAMAEFDSNAMTSQFFEWMDLPRWDGTPNIVRVFVEANAKALDLADRAAALPSCRFPPPGRDPLALDGSWNFEFHSLLLARGRLALVRADPAEALRSARTIRGYARAQRWTAAGSPEEFLAQAHAAHCERDALSILAGLAESAAAGDLAEAAVFTGGRWEMKGRWDGFLVGMRDSVDRGLVGILREDEEVLRYWGLDRRPPLAQRLRGLLSGEKDGSAADLPLDLPEIRRQRAAYDTLLPLVLRRDAAALAPGGALDKALAPADEPEPGRFVLLTPGLASGGRQALAHEALLEVVRAALALRAFQAREGWPARSLEELVPSYLPSVPIDPGDGKPIRFEARPDGGAAWSVLSEGVWESTRKEEDRPRPRIEWKTEK